MKITVNGKKRSIPESLPLAKLLSSLEMPSERVAVEVNKEVVRKTDWDGFEVSENDRIEIIHFVGGG